MDRRQLVHRAATGLAAWQLAAWGNAQAADVFPSHPIRLVVPLAVGGGTDAVSRLVAMEMGRLLGQSVAVDNIAGGSTTIGTSTVVRALPDGYTLLTGTPSLAINPSLRRDMKYDALKDLQPISLLSQVPYVLVAGPSLKARNLRELLALARSQPGFVTVGSPGIGSGGHLAAELFQMLADIKLTHVPYKGTGPALTDMRGGQIHLLFGTSPAVTPLVETGALAALGVTSAQRMSTLPQVPTIAEAGVPGYQGASWYGLFAPAKTPREVIGKLNGAAHAALRNEAVVAAIRQDGGEPSASTPEELRSFLAAEIAKWSKVIAKAGLRAE